jgi:hypothetical protein
MFAQHQHQNSATIEATCIIRTHVFDSFTDNFKLIRVKMPRKWQKKSIHKLLQCLVTFVDSKAAAECSKHFCCGFLGQGPTLSLL